VTPSVLERPAETRPRLEPRPHHLAIGTTAAGPVPRAGVRPRVAGKFLAVGDQKLYVRGVTYGTFRPGEGGAEYPTGETLLRDFAAMARAGINAVRTYTVPPRSLLDAAQRHGLWVMVGVPWEQHVAFLDDRGRGGDIERRVRAGVRGIAGHPALLCIAVGNEVPAPIVRWLGAPRVERFLARLARAVRAEDPHALVTYVNYPSTEYLRLPELDFLAFNVYLEDRERYEAYLARLQNLAGDRPLVMAEIGLDSRRNGEGAQATSLEWQVRSAFAGGAAGAFVFAWTDEWHRGGFDIEDWDFGLVGRDRRPKPALAAVSRAFAEVPFPPARRWPRVSVVVCSYNGSRTIRDCLEGLARLDYPDFEVIVVNDGSTDETPAIAAEYNVRLINQENRGLSAARNRGLEAATGEIVAYTDDDARPDPHWLRYLAATFVDGGSGIVAAGGPNIAPAGDGWIADCIANAPGGPVEVLLNDRIAEHVPGCNMAFRREALAAVGGFDPVYRAAGDDVDACWRIMAMGEIAFSPAAMVWHHRRNSMRTYWKQQQGYGKAEALLERKWPEKYNALGHFSWAGRLYGKGLTVVLGRRARLYGGTWGRAAYQSLYEPGGYGWTSLPLMPEWYLLIAALGGLGLLGFAWAPLLLAWPAAALALLAPLAQAAISARQARFTSAPRTWWQRARLRLVTFFMHLLQPLARLRGRLRWGLSLWRLRTPRAAPALPRNHALTTWSETWLGPESRLETIERDLKAAGGAVLRGGDFEQWDLELRSGIFGSARLLSTVEEHGGGKQLARFRVWARVSGAAVLLTIALGGLAAAAFIGGSPFVAAVVGLFALAFLVRLVVEPALGVGALVGSVRRLDE
jgi:O-antigen biosynthesis protein